MESIEKKKTGEAGTQQPVAGPDSLVGQVSGDVAVSDEGLVLFPQPVKEDPYDPLNWSFFQKHAILAIVMALYFMFTYITTTTVPSFPDLQSVYSASLAQVNWTVAIPALGLAVGPLIWSSPADIIGRRPIFMLGTLMALASTIGAALAPDYPSYMAARFFQGLGVSPASNVGFAIINDIFFEHERGQKVGLWVLAIDLGLYFGPLIGGFVNLAGYAWIQWLSAILFGVILVAEMLFLPETLYPRGLMVSTVRGAARAADVLDEKSVGAAAATTRDGLDFPRTRGLSPIHVKPLPGFEHPKPHETLTRFLKTFRYAVVPASVVTYCFAWYWWVLSVVTVIPIAYATFSPQSQGLLFLGLIVGTLISEVFFSGTLSDWLIVKLTKPTGRAKQPEMRLWLAYPAALLTAVGLIVWGVSVDEQYHWMVGQVGLGLFGAGIQMGNTAVCSYIFDAYPKQSMAMLTFYAVMLNLSAFVNPFFIVPWLETAGFTWTFSGQAIITVVLCIPVFALVHRFGGSLRSKSGSPPWVNPEFTAEATVV